VVIRTLVRHRRMTESDPNVWSGLVSKPLGDGKFCERDMAQRDWTAWLGRQDSNLRMASRIIPLKCRTNFLAIQLN
jgi:hypothetical protein